MLVNTALNYIFTFCHEEDDDDPFKSRTCTMTILEESEHMSVLSLSFSSTKARPNRYVLCCYEGDCWITDIADEVCAFLRNPMNIEECTSDLIDFDLQDDELEELSTAVKIAADHCCSNTYPDEAFVRKYIYDAQESKFR